MAPSARVCPPPPGWVPGRLRLRDVDPRRQRRDARQASGCAARPTSAPCEKSRAAEARDPEGFRIWTPEIELHGGGGGRPGTARGRYLDPGWLAALSKVGGRAQYTVTFTNSGQASADAAVGMPQGSAAFGPSSSCVAAEESEEEDMLGVMPSESATPGRRGTARKASTRSGTCSKTHPVFLCDKVYTPKCEELGVNANSGIKRFLVNSVPCFCSLTVVNFRDHLLGDRGILGVLPLFRNSRQLRSLNLAGNGIHTTGLRAVVTVFQENNEHLSLAVLDLSRNPIPASCTADLTRLLAQKKNLLMLGLTGTTLPMDKRQRLLRQCLANFEAAEPRAMHEAWNLTREGERFADRDLWIQCGPILMSRSRDAGSYADVESCYQDSLLTGGLTTPGWVTPGGPGGMMAGSLGGMGADGLPSLSRESSTIGLHELPIMTPHASRRDNKVTFSSGFAGGFDDRVTSLLS